MGAGASKSTLRLANTIQSDRKEIKSKRVSRARLVNLLNRINFRNGEITIHFKHNRYRHALTVLARPQICNQDFLRCLWSEHFDAEKRLKHFHFQYFTFTDGLNQIQVSAILLEMNDNGIYLELPEYCQETQTREIKRHKCRDITAQLLQDGKVVQAKLATFSAQSFALNLQSGSNEPDILFTNEEPVSVVLIRDSLYLFSGTCEVVRHNLSATVNQLVLKPVRSNIQLFKPKEVRSERLVLNPLPSIHFLHPLTGKRVNLTLLDISGTGFGVAEDEESSVLMPGLIIPELEVEFVHGFSVNCKAQVVYRLLQQDHVKCGIAILDMDMEDHVRLSSYLHQAKNRHSSISTTKVDIDALWDFFFESNFIYPDKYIHISEQRERFQQLYQKLYNDCPRIARHVIYQDKGRIYGHVAMFRYYRDTWLMHHHAAIKSSKHKAGLVVMNHILQYINECHTLPSARMKYIACYFRPNNRFADRVFGGAARALNDPKKCSLDAFAYLHFEPAKESIPLAKGWTLEKTSVDDLQLLAHWYDAKSGGLMLNGLDLVPGAEIMDRLTNEEYSEAGFDRSRELYSLKADDELQALFTVNISDIGLNMSDLTNCIQAFVLDDEQTDRTTLQAVLSQLADKLSRPEVPVLLYPKHYAEKVGIEYDKPYELTVLDLENISPYLIFIHSLTTQKDRKVKHIS